MRSVVTLFGLLCVFATFFLGGPVVPDEHCQELQGSAGVPDPVMLLSLAPGVASLLPGVELGSGFAVVPLLNMVLLARETVLGTASLGLAAVVVGSTLLYGAAALALAARWFGSDAVLAGSTGGWADLLRRPERPVDGIRLETAAGTVAMIFPAILCDGDFCGPAGGALDQLAAGPERAADGDLVWRFAAGCHAVATGVRGGDISPVGTARDGRRGRRDRRRRGVAAGA